MTKNKNNKSHMIFYHNTEPNNPDKLASSVRKELKYFESFLLKAIDSMDDVGRYELTWEKDEDLIYLLYPYQILEVKKPKNRIILQIKDAFSERKVIIRENGEQIQYETYEITKEGVVLILEDSEKLAIGEKVWYGLEKVDWQFLYSGFSGKIDSIKDETGKKYDIFKKEERVDSYILHIHCKNCVPKGITLFINDVPVEYSERDIITLKGTELYDNKGHLGIIDERDNFFKIHTGRKIQDELRDSTGRFYQYSLEEKKKENGVWIVLKEHEEDQISADDDQKTKIDIFFELISSSSDFEIWESPDVKHNDNKHRIRIGKIIREENRLLLEREPKTAKIYPPRNTYQLDMQKNAIRTLMFRPAPEHRNLLRLFEPYDETQWYEPSADHTEWKLKWEFLTDMEREGTDEQREFVLKALNTPDFAILEGPPGSGKTTAISEIIYQLLNQRKRVLLSASTHVAVDNVIEKLEEKYRNSGGAKENGIVPLRIGREESVSEDVIQYQIENRKEVMKKRIENEKWFRDSSPENQNYYLEEMVINSSNLICGTTIGILQFPHFKKAKKEEPYIIPEFDYLIIDEASKTTFQEFLVPAIYAKKWIVIGDVRQLPPYTDTLHVRVNLDGVLGNKAKKAQVVFLKLLFDRGDVKIDNKRIPPPKFIFVDKLETVKEIFKTLPTKIQKNVKRSQGKRWKSLGDYNYAFVTKQPLGEGIENIECLDENTLQNKRVTLFDKDIIFVEKEVYRMKWGIFPQTHILIYPNTSWQDIHEYRHLHWHSTRGRGEYAYKLSRGESIENPWDIKDEIMNSLKKDWAGELAWRMIRVHELSMAQSDETQGKSKEYYLASMHALMPPDDKESGNAWRDIRKIGQIFLTSVLSSIQEGVTPDWKEKENKSTMSHGFIDCVKEPRYTKLSYQHRMHPDISSIPRDIFYRGEALNDDCFVENEGRIWNYNRYNKRVVWIDVKGKVHRNTNENESQKILSELENFVKWVNEQNERKNVIILSFYEQQRKHIRDLLRRKYLENRCKETKFIIDGVDVRNYTVDKVQGKEGDLVLLSMVQNKRVGFMDSPNRLNVALTRAKYQLVIIGDKEYFSTQRHSKELAEIAQRIKTFHIRGIL